MGIFLFLLLFTGGAGALSLLLRKDFAKTLPVYLFLTVFLTYIGGLFGGMLAGFWLVVGFSVFGLLFIVFCFAKQKTELVWQYVFTRGYIAFLVLLVFVYLINVGRHFADWDEYSHWGPMLKETFHLDAFHNDPRSRAFVHPDYPPALTQFEYVWCRVIGQVTEAGARRAVQFFTLSLFLPAFAPGQKKAGKATVLCLALIAVVLPSVPEANLYQSIYADAPMAVLMGYLLYSVVTAEKTDAFTALNIGLAGFVLVLTKQMGIFGALMALGYLVLHMLFSALGRVKKIPGAFTWRQYLLLFAAVAVPALAAYGSWQAHMSSLALGDGQFSIGKMLEVIPRLFTGGLSDVQQQVYGKYSQALFDVSVGGGVLTFTYATAAFAFVLAGIWLACRARASAREHAVRVYAYSLGLPVFFIAYAFAMLLLYMTGYIDYEALNLASYARYMGTMVTAVAVSLFLLLATGWAQREKAGEDTAPQGGIKLPWLGLAFVFCVFCTPAATYRWMYPLWQQDNIYHQQKREAEAISAVLTEGDIIHFITQESNGGMYYGLVYYSMPKVTVPPWYVWSLGPPFYDGDIWSKDFSGEEWMDLLLRDGCTHVYIAEKNDYFVETYDDWFRDDIVDGGLYRVEMDGEEPYLVLMDIFQ